MPNKNMRHSASHNFTISNLYKFYLCEFSRNKGSESSHKTTYIEFYMLLNSQPQACVSQ